MRSASAASTTAASSGFAKIDTSVSEAVAVWREDETSSVLDLLGETQSGDFGIAVLLQSDLALGPDAI